MTYLDAALIVLALGVARRAVRVRSLSNRISGPLMFACYGWRLGNLHVGRGCLQGFCTLGEQTSDLALTRCMAIGRGG